MEALYRHLNALVFSPPLPIAWTNVAFTPPADGAGKPKPYLRATSLRSPNGRPTITRSVRYAGLFQVDVYWPLAAGEQAARDIAGAIAGHFDNTRLRNGALTICVDERPTDGPSLIEGPMMQIPVTVRWYALA
ncbi:Bacteriophage related protein of unknown function [Kaistia soli DSM 19436]|uniref:Uncharacterized protein n=1 Tax=Kaistia soli DSM 19436 TaxID=1122133 RepID=A0A1M5MQZ5_9HYPH|nr:Bacteriophage related protein of unknown function [Kaistia soli DSM 19436]